MGTHLRVLIKSYPMNTNMTGFRWFSKIFCLFVLWTKVASAVVGLSSTSGLQRSGQQMTPFLPTYNSWLNRNAVDHHYPK